MNRQKKLQIKSLQPFVTAEEISPTIVLDHTDKIKKHIISLKRKEFWKKDDNIVDYTISNITMQENMIAAFGSGYSNDVFIYASQVSASISEILKDIALLLN